MKTTGFRASVLYILLAVFLAGIAYLVFSVFISGEKWVVKPYNGHVYASDTTVSKGDILDRNNVLLAYTQNGERVYSTNLDIRKALLHTVGDSSGYIGTSVQSALGAKLVGYNFFTGLNPLPQSQKLLSNDIKLTLDAQLSATAYNALNGKNGAVVITNYLTGEVLCKVSTPTYDPMNVPSDLQTNGMYNGVFLDNTVSSTYTAGSIFKLVVAACALENLENAQSLTYDCSGELYVGNSVVTCLGHHGELNMKEALGNSCNVYFANLALELGTDLLGQTAEKLGFNKEFSFKDFYSKSSTIDLKNASDIELAWSGVGQYNVRANPMHMAVLMGAIANGGIAEQLYITNQNIFSDINTDTKLMDTNTANILKDYMRGVVTNYYGDSKFLNMGICAKTGTAEVDGQKPNSWIVGFSENKETPYAFSIVVEDAGSGIGVAGNIAIELLSKIKS